MGQSSSEIASLWSTYMLDSLSISVLKYFLNHIKYAQIQSILEYAFNISQDQISRIRVIYEEENHPMPKGFTDEDVILDAPRLYSDPYYLFYLKEMGRLGMANYTDALTTATRSDISNLFNEIIEVYGSILSEDDIPTPMTWDTEVTASTSSVFSDRLMMFHVQATNSIGMRDFGAAIGMAMRRDVATHHIRLSAETLKYAEDGLKIMINHGWLEEPPQMVNRDKLAE